MSKVAMTRLVQLIQQVLAGQLDRAARVDEPGQRLDEHRAVQGRQVVGQLVELVWVEHAEDLLETYAR